MADEINITVIEQPIEVAIAITDSPIAVNIVASQGIEEAPINGTTYGRKDAAWLAVVTSVAWGAITGTLSNQTDLQVALDARQPLDATLTSIAALGTAADKMIYTTGVDTWAEATLTAFARSILDDANAAAVRTTIGAGTGSGDLLAANNLSDLANVATARTNLGLGAIALEASPLAASKGGTGIAAGASASLSLPNLAITLGGGGAAQTYTLPTAGGTFALLNAANLFSANQIMGNNIKVQSRDAANVSNVNVIFMDASDNLVFGQQTITADMTFFSTGSARITVGGSETVRITSVALRSQTGATLGTSSLPWGQFFGTRALLDGNADVIQLRVQGHSTQTADLQTWENSVASVLASISPDGTINTTAVYKVDGTQVVTNRVIDARIDDAINSGDATTDGVIDAIRDALITHGLIAAA